MRLRYEVSFFFSCIFFRGMGLVFDLLADSILVLVLTLQISAQPSSICSSFCAVG